MGKHKGEASGEGAGWLWRRTVTGNYERLWCAIRAKKRLSCFPDEKVRPDPGCQVQHAPAPKGLRRGGGPPQAAPVVKGISAIEAQ